MIETRIISLQVFDVDEYYVLRAMSINNFFLATRNFNEGGKTLRNILMSRNSRDHDFRQLSCKSELMTNFGIFSFAKNIIYFFLYSDINMLTRESFILH